MGKRLASAAVLLVAVAAAAAPATGQVRRYHGYVDVLGGRGPVREATQGAGWRAIFRERARGRVRYSVCLRNLDNGVRHCWGARTSARGTSRVFVARFVNDRGGPGAWQARWKIRGDVVSTWHFRVQPEFP
jgi:hypothetical protein